MSSFVIFGAGPIGAAVAHKASAGHVAARVVLVDDAADVARGLALDIRQAGAIAGSCTAVEGTNDVGAVVGAAVVVVADRYGAAGEWRDDAGLGLLMQVRALNPRAVILCAGAAQTTSLETFVRERDADRRRVVGTAPEALRSAMTALVCLETGAAPADVSLIAIGRPPTDLFVPWEGASVGGSRAGEMLPAAVVARLDRQLPYLWPPGPLVLAAAAVRVARLVSSQVPGWACVTLVPPADGDRGVGAVALPARHVDGAIDPVWPELAPRDRVRLESALTP